LRRTATAINSPGGPWPVFAPPVLLVMAGTASIFVTGPDWMPGFRLLMPYLPLWTALAVASVVAVVGVLTRKVGVASLVIGVGVLTWFFWVQWPTMVRDRAGCLLRAGGYVEGHAELAGWLQEQAQPGDTVALMDIGLIGFMNPDLRILDITGLTDRHIAKSPGPLLDKHFDPSYVLGQRPEYLVIVLHVRQDESGSYDWRELKPYTAIEERLLLHPSFSEHYVRMREPPPEADELTRLACVTGAERVFRHAYPGYAYFLAVFQPEEEKER